MANPAWFECKFYFLPIKCILVKIKTKRCVVDESYLDMLVEIDRLWDSAIEDDIIELNRLFDAAKKYEDFKFAIMEG